MVSQAEISSYCHAVLVIIDIQFVDQQDSTQILLRESLVAHGELNLNRKVTNTSVYQALLLGSTGASGLYSIRASLLIREHES